MINQLIAYLNLSWVGVLITLITFIVAVALTLFLYFRGKQRKSLSYYINNSLIIDRANTEKPDQIEVYFSGKKVDKLYKTLIYIWNSGNQTIKKDELYTRDPLRVSIESNSEQEILSIKIINVTRDVINFSTDSSQESDGYQISFDYLDQADGAVIEVLHNGSVDDLKLNGVVMGILKIKNVEVRKDNFIVKAINEGFMLNSNLASNIPHLFGTIVIILGLFLALIALYLYINPQTKVVASFSDSKGLFLGAVMYIAFGLILVFSNKRKYPKNLEVKESREKSAIN